MAYSGWDIGGAHLKVARSDNNGNLLNVIQLPCALWKGIDQLQIAFAEAKQQLNNEADHHVITMTGELVDAFQNRQQGVAEIIDCACQHLSDNIKVYAGQNGWLTAPAAKSDWLKVASMNWQASAMLAATHLDNGLFIDIGSTTCDIIPVIQQQIAPVGYTDHDRQKQGELVYTGAIRTPLMAITDSAPFNGQQIRLTAEWFASTADIWCILNKLDADTIQDSSADGQPWSNLACQRRLARMLATDVETASEQQWQNVARWFAEKQVQRVTEACLQILSSHEGIGSHASIVGAGVGRFIVELCAQRLDMPYIDFTDFCNGNKSAAEHAPATALALLAQHEFT